MGKTYATSLSKIKFKNSVISKSNDWNTFLNGWIQSLPGLLLTKWINNLCFKKLDWCDYFQLKSCWGGFCELQFICEGQLLLILQCFPQFTYQQIIVTPIVAFFLLYIFLSRPAKNFSLNIFPFSPLRFSSPPIKYILYSKYFLPFPSSHFLTSFIALFIYWSK